MPKQGTEPKVMTATSGKDGAFAFQDLDPGTYVVRSFNPASTTRAITEVSVEAGKTATANLPLIR
jgi:hypothetical protein